jgi:hypothetical protein
VLWWVLLTSCSALEVKPAPPPPPKAEPAVLLFTSELRGSLEPCGCSQAMRGGIERTAFQVKAARDEGHPVLYFDTGDTLFGQAEIAEAAVGQQERKAQTLAQALVSMGLTARAAGPLDDARGPEFHAAFQLPELAPASVTLFDAGPHKVGVVVAPTVEQVKPLATQARVQGAEFVVALLQVPWEDALPVLRDETAAADLVLVSRSRSEVAGEETRSIGGRTKLIQVQNKGRTLLRVDLNFISGHFEWLKSGAERERELQALDTRIAALKEQVNQPMVDEALRALKQAKLDEVEARRAGLANAPLPMPEDHSAAWARLVPIEASLPSEPVVASLVAAYDTDVGVMNLAWAKEHGQSCEPPTPEKPGFIGNALCVACHPYAGQVWSTMRHAQAYEDLKKKGKQYHLDCVGCHLSGWQQPGGVCRLDQTEGREHVSCESCHGPGSPHLAKPEKGTIERTPGPKVCVKCHDRENSTHFDYDTYVAKLKGPGHGEPPPPPPPAPEPPPAPAPKPQPAKKKP